MRKQFYPKLALNNLRRNAQTYLPYLITAVAMVMMLYMIVFLAGNTGLAKMPGGDTLRMLLSFGSVVVGCFAVVFLLYTNSFLIKRRKKELGLLNILGMEKKHIAQVMFWETLFTAVMSLIFGLAGGILFSKLMFLLLLKIMHFPVMMGFEISVQGIVAVLVLFGAVFFLTFLNNLRQVHTARPIELLRGGQVGEREPRTRWLLALVGFASLGAGYYLALIVDNPLTALMMFFVAVLLVMLGTYCLFVAGSIAVLKLLRRSKRFYYRPRHFINVSGMLYRMKQNGVGLANICILSTMVLVTLSTTISLYVGFEDVLSERYGRDMLISVDSYADSHVHQIRSKTQDVIKNHGLTLEDPVELRHISFTAAQEGDTFITDREKPYFELAYLQFIPLEDYKRLTQTSAVLNEQEVLVYSSKGRYEHKQLKVLNRTFEVKESLASFPVDMGAIHLMNSLFVVVRDMDLVEEVRKAQAEVYGEWASLPGYYLAFNLPANRESKLAVHGELKQTLSSQDFLVRVESPEVERADFLSLYGGLFFLGLFLGIVFIMGAVLIIYYKQITEGYEDRQRFLIMQQVGMGRSEVRRTIRSQVLMVFFLPLLAAGIHVAFAFKMITKLLVVFNLTNVTLFALCTVATLALFALLYGVVYIATARVYYKIVAA